MTENLTVTTERVDDIPLLVAQASKVGLAELLDEQFPSHGNWRGTSLGWTTTIWLSHILSEGDHRLNQVQPWVEQRLATLTACSGQALRPLAWSDDRLALVLDELSKTSRWQALEAGLNQRTVRVYRLRPRQVRVDSTTTSGYWTVTENGLFQFGHSKDRRPDLPQLKVMLSTLDPLGLPVATQVVAGNSADDPLYLPAIAQVRQSLGEKGLLYVGDCKMGASQTRATIAADGDYYLCPLADKQLPSQVLDSYLQPVWDEHQAVTPLYRENEAGEREQIAEGYERSLALSHEVAGQSVSWTERRLVVRSLAQAAAAGQALDTRLQNAQTELAQLTQAKQGKKRLDTLAAMQAAVAAILQHYRVTDFLQVALAEQVQAYPVRAYGQRPARLRTERLVTLSVQVNERAVAQAKRRLGWRIYATNQPAEMLSLDQAILAYREEYLVERGFGRLKGKSLSLSPMYLQSEARAVGLIRLLSLALRLLTLVEFQVRRRLAEAKATLAGLYAGNPQRATARPTAEAVLKAFKGIDLSVVTIGQQVHRHLTPLSELQQRILSLLEFPPAIYTCLLSGFSEPSGNMTEP